MKKPLDQTKPKTEPEGIKDRNTSRIEYIFEKILWSSRFTVILAVVSSVLISISLFIIGTVDTFAVIGKIAQSYFERHIGDDLHTTILSDAIGAIDTYLIAVVLLIFAFGLYELFISRIDPAREGEMLNILDIRNLEELKHKIAQVILMALIVKFFQFALVYKVSELLSFAVLAACILALSLTVFLMRKTQDKD